MSDNKFYDFQDPESAESYAELSQNSTAVVPLDTSEDAHFSEQMFSSIQERLTRIMKRVHMANSAMAQMKRKLQTRLPSSTQLENADKFAGGDNPMRFDNIQGRDEDTNE
ncbi:uncharacterized protein LOC108087461 [Drosophila ficusphila]|uniref:uncharacterized protein LOC108087461 n=1 Tax=Drosophila ficusphila TaxID=30025 RepID=UPI0007E7473B|nr:uncharacterized protein LOC108087461 [Drosophila ficusphila]